MPKPTASDVHYNRPLTNISIAFTQDASEFIADQVFPNIPVQKQSDTYFLYDQGDFYRSEMEVRAPGAESAGGGWALSTASYSALVYALHKDIDDQVRANADDPINMDRDAVRYLTQQALLKRDKVWAAAFFIPSTWTGSTTGGDITPGTLWSTGGTPFKDIRAQIVSVHKKTGYKPNTFVAGLDVWTTLADHADALDRIKYTQGPAIVAPSLFAEALGISKFVVSGAVENTANEGATATYDVVADADDALLVYAAPNPGLLVPSAGYTFSWTGLLGAGNQGQRIKQFRMEQNSSDRVEIEMAFAQKVVSATLGVFFSEVVA